ncbi:MAG: hypothetical protein AMXMBFR12_03290 [Candidatus Babeliales bacterium]
MNNRVITLLVLFVWSGLAFPHSIPLFSDWKKRCKVIEHYKDFKAKNPWNEHDYSKTATHYAEFLKAVDDITAWYKNSGLTKSSRWVNNKAYNSDFFQIQAKSFDPYVQALCVSPGTEIIMFGDRHGDVRSTVSMIKELRKKNYFESDDSFKLKPGILLVGLGDYVDRGNAGAETFLTMLWLKLENPEQVILVRGNHEDCDMHVNISQFQFELQQKLGSKFTAADLRKVNRIYDYMPVAVFIGSGAPTVDFMVGCHGFLELGYAPHNLLELAIQYPGVSVFEKLGTLHRKKHARSLSNSCQKALINFANISSAFANEMGDDLGITLTSPCAPVNLGWMWSYAIVDDGKKVIDYNSGNQTWQWGKELTEQVFKYWKGSNYTVSWIFRGHQHAHNYEYGSYGSIMNNLWANDGLYRLWSTDSQAHSLAPYGAFTINVAPDNIYAGYTPQSTYPGFNYDTWIVVKTGLSSDKWSVKIFNKAMFELPEYPVYMNGKKIIPQKLYC